MPGIALSAKKAGRHGAQIPLNVLDQLVVHELEHLVDGV